MAPHNSLKDGAISTVVQALLRSFIASVEFRPMTANYLIKSARPQWIGEQTVQKICHFRDTGLVLNVINACTHKLSVA